MKLIPGQIMHHRYRLEERLAQGGMGEVWRGVDIELDRPVAIKALRSDLEDPDNNKLRRLRAEAHNSANLAHPNIAALFDYYENDGVGFLVMEYVDSPSLAQIYKERAPLPAVDLLPILIQVARGLYVAHSHGVIHRDVKPANIMVSQDGEVKITDFGVSYSTNQAQITQDGMVVGTAQYISPEQAQGEQATPQSDIYSLGVVAYEGLCGHRPFTGKTSVDIAAAHVNEPVPPLPDSIDWRLREYVMGMLAKDPKDRPRDALEVSRNLQVILDHLWDEQTANIPPVRVARQRPVGRTVYSAPHEPPAWMVDLTDRAAIKRSREADRVIDVHFDAAPSPVIDAAAAAAAKSAASTFASASAAESGAMPAMPESFEPKGMVTGPSSSDIVYVAGSGGASGVSYATGSTMPPATPVSSVATPVPRHGARNVAAIPPQTGLAVHLPPIADVAASGGVAAETPAHAATGTQYATRLESEASRDTSASTTSTSNTAHEQHTQQPKDGAQ